MSEDSDWQPEIKWRTVITIIVGVSWLFWIIAWWYTWSEGYSTSQKFALALLSLGVVAGIMSAVWLPYAYKYGSPEDRMVWKLRGFGTRVAGSAVVIAAFFLLVFWWLFYEAEGWGWCGSVGLIALMFLALASILGPIWVRWSMREQRVVIQQAAHAKLSIKEMAEKVGEADSGEEEGD